MPHDNVFQSLPPRARPPHTPPSARVTRETPRAPRSPCSVVTREQIIQAVWPEASSEGVSEQAIDALVRRLRERVGEADDDFRFSSDEVNFWLSEFQQPKTDASQPRRVTPGARPTSAGSRPAPTMSPSAAADSTTSAETTDSASPVDATSKQDSPRSTGGRDKEAKATGGSDFDFPADYLKAIQQEIEGDDTP